MSEHLAKVPELEKMLQETSEPQEKIKFLEQIEQIFWGNSMYAKSKEYAEQRLVIAKEMKDDKSQTKAYNSIGLNYSYLEKYDIALEYLQKALQISRRMRDVQQLSMIINNIGVVYEKMKDYDRAQEYFLEALKYMEGERQPLNNAGIIYYHRGEYEKALEFVTEANKLAVENEDTFGVGITLINLADIYNKMDQLDKALGYYEDAKKLLDEIDDKFFLISVFYGLGTVYKRKGEFDKALKNLLQAEELAADLQTKTNLKDTYISISEIYAELEDYVRAYEYYRKFVEIKDELYTEELSKKISEMQRTFEVEKRELEAMRIVEKVSRLVSIGVIAGGITHEINQPLNAIKISSDSILYWNKRNPNLLPELFVKEMQQISDSSRRIDDIINHMRQFWTNTDLEERFSVDLNETVRNALSLVSRQIAAHGIEMIMDIEEEPFIIKSNKLYIEQIIVNLINNAIQVLENSPKEEKWIEITTYSDDLSAVLEILDNGPGLPDGVGDKLYDPFYTTKEKAENMGLGLAIVKQIVDRFHGSIKHRNTEEGGACFTISFTMQQVQ